jgi:hypothetical protein
MSTLWLENCNHSRVIQTGNGNFCFPCFDKLVNEDSSQIALSRKSSEKESLLQTLFSIGSDEESKRKVLSTYVSLVQQQLIEFIEAY